MIVPRDGAGVRYARFGGAAGRRLAKSLALGLRGAPRRVLAMRVLAARVMPWRAGAGAAFGRIARSSPGVTVRLATGRPDDAVHVGGAGFGMRRAESFRGSVVGRVRRSEWSFERLRTGRAGPGVPIWAGGLRGLPPGLIRRAEVAAKLMKTVPRNLAGGASPIGAAGGADRSVWIIPRRIDDRLSGRCAAAGVRKIRTVRRMLASRQPMSRYDVAPESGGVVVRAMAPVARDRGGRLGDQGFDGRRPAAVDPTVRVDEHRRRVVTHQGVVDRRLDRQPVGPVETRGHFGERLTGAAIVPEDMARMVRDLFADEARRPPSGVTGFDGALSPIFPGRKPGF